MSNKRNLNSKVNEKGRPFFSLFLVMVVLSFAFVACKKDKDKDTGNKNNGIENPSVIDAKNVVDGSSDIFIVNAELWNYDAKDYNVIASCEYKNSSFKLNLPETVPDECLYTIGENWYFLTEIISDENAKVADLGIFAYTNEEEYLGKFLLGDDMQSVEVTYIYADRDFTIIGIDESLGLSEIYDCSFKKGWNIRYFVKSRDGYLRTTKKPAGVILKWFYDSK